MKGSHKVIVETERMRYTFTIRRNITVILGDSATGKTTLVEFLNMYSRRGEGSGVSVQSDVSCVVFNDVSGQWQTILSGITHSIVFIDEGQPFIFSKEFAEAIRGSDNYYVLITRRPLHNLPYSTKEIYGIRTTGKYHFPEKVYQEFYPVYEDVSKGPSDAGTIL
ncbi:MAG: Fis family transcriptional regulator [Lachnospiraceae bacterium]|nr:Fis family transcriptional regulator [Lachnospiraceae bacterium]